LFPFTEKHEIYIPPEPSTDEADMFGGGIGVGINFEKFDEIEVKVTGKDTSGIKPIAHFKEAGLRDLILENIEKSGYKKPTPIQKHAIPIIMAKRDIMGCAVSQSPVSSISFTNYISLTANRFGKDCGLCCANLELHHGQQGRRRGHRARPSTMRHHCSNTRVGHPNLR